MGSVEGVNIVVAGAYVGAHVEETSYNSGVIEVYSGHSGLFSSRKNVHAVFDSKHVESMNVVNVEKGIGALWVTLEIRTVDVQWKDGKKSLVKVAAPIYDKMLAGMYR